MPPLLIHTPILYSTLYYPGPPKGFTSLQFILTLPKCICAGGSDDPTPETHAHTPQSYKLENSKTDSQHKGKWRRVHTAAHTNSRVHLCWGLVVIYDLRHLHSRPSQIHDWSVLKDSITEEYRQPWILDQILHPFYIYHRAIDKLSFSILTYKINQYTTLGSKLA